MLGQVKSHRHLVSDYAKDNPNDQYLSNFYFKSDVKVPVVSTCGALWYSSPSKVTEECAKTMSLYGYEPANVVCPYTCTGDDGGDGDIVECIDKTICEKGSTEMKFKVTGTTCEESSNTQGDKFECTDNLPISFPAYINLSAKGQVYFEGMVDKGDIITLSNGGNKFKADTDAVVKASPTGVTYQSLTYHSSCSKNLFIGDSFGAIQLLEFTNSKQGTITCTPVTSPSSTPSVAPTSNPSEIPSSKPSLSPIEPSKIYITSRNKDVDRSPMERQINDGNQTIVVESSVCGHNITNLELFFTPKPDTEYELWRYAGTGGSHELFVHGVEIKQLVHGRLNVKIYNSLVHHNYLLNTPGNNLAWRMVMAIAEEQLERIDNNMMQVEENDRFATVLESMGADRRNKESLEILRAFCASLLADSFISKNGLNGDYSDASIQPFYYDS